MFSDPIYCTDSLTDGKNELLAKINKVEGNINYFTEQAKETDELYKEALMKNFPDDMKEEKLLVKRESEINLNTEKRVLRVLKDKAI